jgi:hypothetical protein
MHIDHSAQKLPTSPGAHTCLLFDSLEDYKSQADKYILDGLQKSKKVYNCQKQMYRLID